jgi:opacity protein-like surface antigen
MRYARIAASLAAVVLVPPSAWAQSSQGAIVSGVVAATAIESSAKPAFVGSVAYRFNRVLGFGIELTSIPTLTPRIPVIPARDPIRIGDVLLPQTTIAYSEDGGDATVFTTNVRLEIPTITRRLVPYVAGGGGVASVREHITMTITPPPPFTFSSGDVSGFSGVFVPGPARPPITQRVASTSTNLALTLGGGVGVLATDRLSIDIDLRYLRTLGSRDRDIGRFGVGASYRF